MHDTFNACEWLLDRHITEGRGGHTAVRCQGESVSYAEVLELTEAVATGLRRLGLRPEERVALVMLDSVEYVATFLAALRIGAVPVLTNPLLPGRDLGVI
ncbi:MAG TPA: AMP-binding protein, partial [Acidimicrobiales bacterium]|nr:AMP-binding protein [Acidimicrobiales bacterium]